MARMSRADYITIKLTASLRFVILVGYKQDQKSDIEYLRKNDPPVGWDK